MSQKKQSPRSNNLLKFEVQVKSQGYQKIAGVDEAGRGCLAGPVIAACVILPWEEDLFTGVNDSKQLTPKQRDHFYDLILKKATGVGVGLVEAGEIDRINILKASLKAMTTAVQSCSIDPDFVLVDGREKISISIPQKPIIKGDCLSLSIAAASIVAKVTRDRLMIRLGKKFPQFGFAKHKGYATRQHYQEIETNGPTYLHRLTFRGVDHGL
ncbi:MAG: ribonuclease HII [Deltaproteobacteria bacterium RIFCSPLOWO2_02_FULL_46_8]|nr:MAG: ribonuclease HII [Deltaproteobacteria bacterium RIFCSPLOWO2_02_FULL_46_8]